MSALIIINHLYKKIEIAIIFIADHFRAFFCMLRLCNISSGISSDLF